MSATNTETLGWLVNHVGDPQSRFLMIRRPFSVVVDQKSMAVAVDGIAMIAVEQNGEWPFADIPAPEIEKARPFLERKPTGKPIDIGALRVWCGLPAEAACPTCQDKRTIDCQGCLGSGVGPRDCETCGHGHECVCRYCEGTKTQWCSCCPKSFEQARGLLEGVVVNRTRLGRMLDVRLARGPVLLEVHSEADGGSARVHFYGPGWTSVLMGLRLDPSEEGNYPVFGEPES